MRDEKGRIQEILNIKCRISNVEVKAGKEKMKK
jgi:hypothetical protein